MTSEAMGAEMITDEERKARTELYWEIDKERDRQHFVHGKWPHHTGDRWTAILTEEVGEAAQAWLQGNEEELKKELIQVCAVAVAFLEALEREEVINA